MTHAALKDQKARIESVRVLTEMRDLGTPPCNFAHAAEELAALNAAIAALSAMEGEAVAWSIEQRNGLSRGGVFRDKQEAMDCGLYDPEIDVVRPLIYGDTAPPPQQAELMALAAKWEADANGAGAYNVTEQEHGRILQSRRCASELRAFATHPTPSPGPQGGVLTPYGMLLDLLAVIHADGGHYTDEHGLEKSWQDARSKWYEASLATPPAHQPGEVVTDEMVRRAQAASEAYWEQEFLSNDCEECAGSGMVPAGDNSQDWCGSCGGVGSIHNGTEDDAMRAALTAALAPKEAGHDR